MGGRSTKWRVPPEAGIKTLVYAFFQKELGDVR